MKKLLLKYSKFILINFFNKSICLGFGNVVSDGADWLRAFDAFLRPYILNVYTQFDKKLESNFQHCTGNGKKSLWK